MQRFNPQTNRHGIHQVLWGEHAQQQLYLLWFVREYKLHVFNDFLQQAQASQLECNSGQYNETGYPAYSYSAIMSKREGITLYIINQEGFSDTQVFNQTKAVIGTMSSQFETWTSSPTRSPVTYSPTYLEPNDDNISASNIATNGLAVMIALLAALFWNIPWSCNGHEYTWYDSDELYGLLISTIGGKRKADWIRHQYIR